MKVLMESLGCDKNLVDAEEMLSALERRGFLKTDDPADADIYIVNTCCFIDPAKEESIGAVLEAARLKEEGYFRFLVVSGCLSERYKDEILKEIPEIDAFIGLGSPGAICEAVEDMLLKNGVSLPEVPAKPNRIPKRVISTGGLYEYLKIADGCDKNCTYCVIPKVRGHFRSVPMEELLQDARELATSGVKELILVAQDTTLYGKDLYGRRSLHVLLEELCRIPGFVWIRLMYCYPEDIYPGLTDVMLKEPKICRYLDIPVQHINDRILKRMNRRTDGEHIRSVIKELREKLPGIALRTTLITGFPGETEEMHTELLDFIKEYRFDRLGVFEYSREEGTPAAGFEGQVPEDIKHRRFGELMAAQQEISAARGKDMTGKVAEVLVEGLLPEDGAVAGRTYADAPEVDGMVFIENCPEAFTGDLLKVKITGSSEYDLIGEIYDESSE